MEIAQAECSECGWGVREKISSNGNNVERNEGLRVLGWLSWWSMRTLDLGVGSSSPMLGVEIA